MIDGKYFDSNIILSHGAPFSVVFGSREIGKSYGQLRRAPARRVRDHEGSGKNYGVPTDTTPTASGASVVTASYTETGTSGVR